MSLQRLSAATSTAVCYIVLASGVFAQAEEHADQTGHDPIVIPEDQKQTLRERHRASLHPGDPLVLVGVEQGDNEIRSRTPALLNSDRHSTKLNDDEAYQRKLALYEGGGHNLQPVAISRPIKEAPAAAPRSEKPESDAPTSGKHKLLSVCIGLLVSALFCVWGFKRYANMFARAGA